MENPDATLGVEFFTDAVENAAKSREAGRPIYDEREFVRIRFPGDNKRELVAPAMEVHFNSGAKAQMTYAERFPGAYAAFKDGLADYVSGTPLSAVAFVTSAQKAELKALNILTVEQLAGLPDSQMRKLGMGGRDMAMKAQDFLKTSQSNGEVERLKEEIAALRAQMQPAPSDDPFAGMEDDDLRNMLTDAGVTPDGRWGRKKLVDELNAIAAKKAKEAA